MTLTHVDPQKILPDSLWFQGLPGDLQEFIFQSGKAVELFSGSRLFCRGDKPCGLYAVLAGYIRITGVNAAGKEAILTLIEAPQWFGEIALFDNKPRTHDALAETDCLLWRLPQAPLLAKLQSNPEYWCEFGQLLTEKLRLSFQLLEDIALLPASVRLARRVLIMAEGWAPKTDTSLRTLTVPQELLGTMLGLSRQTTNQILGDLEAKGLIKVQRNRIEIVDRTGLLDYSNQY